MLRQDLDRRRLMGLAALFGVATTTRRVAADPAPAETIDLWPGTPPGGPGPVGGETATTSGSLKGVTRPRLALYRPTAPNGTAIVVMAGGGYAHLESGHESRPACRWLAGLGITAFELLYRLPGDGWPPQAPFQDGQRALRLVRSRAVDLGLTRLGVLGFSAGGHLAGMTAVRPDAALAPPRDAVDALSARPDFAALLYPVLSMLPPLDHTHSHRMLLGRDPDPAAAAALSVDHQVTPQAPPCFLAQAEDDPISPVENSVAMEAALRHAGVPVELHLFATGGHGWGMGKPGSEPAAWPGLFETWLAHTGSARSLTAPG